MRASVYRSLDRSVQFFGIRGRYLIPMVAGGVLSLAVAGAVRGLLGGLAAIAVFLVLFFVCAALVLALQARLGEKALFRKLAMSRCPQYIHVRPQKLLNIRLVWR